MNARKWTSAFLFLGAYSPLFIILLVKDLCFTCWHLQHPVIGLSILGLAVVSIVVLLFVVKAQKSTGYIVTVSEVKINSDAYLNYTIPYIISFFGVDTSSYNELVALALFLVLLGFISTNSKVVFTNPVMAIMGYRIYSCTTTYGKQIKSNVIVFSKSDLSDNHKIDLKALSKNTFIDLTQPKKEETHDTGTQAT